MASSQIPSRPRKLGSSSDGGEPKHRLDGPDNSGEQDTATKAKNAVVNSMDTSKSAQGAAQGVSQGGHKASQMGNEAMMSAVPQGGSNGSPSGSYGNHDGHGDEGHGDKDVSNNNDDDAYGASGGSLNESASAGGQGNGGLAAYIDDSPRSGSESVTGGSGSDAGAHLGSTIATKVPGTPGASGGGAVPGKGGSNGGPGGGVKDAVKDSMDDSTDSNKWLMDQKEQDSWNRMGGGQMSTEGEDNKNNAKIMKEAANHGGQQMAGNLLGKFLLGAKNALMGGIANLAGLVGGGGLWGGIMAAVKGFFASAGAWLASALAIPLVVAQGAIVTTIVVGIIITGSIAGSAVSNNAHKDGTVVLADCRKNVKAAMPPANPDGDTDANAKHVYSVLKSQGFSDNAIAGVIGNFATEGGIDPTAVEGIFNEKHNIGPRKTEALNDFDSYTQKLMNGYKIAINRNAYRADDGKYYAGLGLAQWTGPKSKHIMDSAKSVSKNWYELDFQLAYMLVNGSPATGGGFWERYKSEANDLSPEAAALYFAKNFEGNTSMAQGERQSSAKQYASQMGSWTADSKYAESIIAMMSSMGKSAKVDKVETAKDSCVSTKGGNEDNSTLAAAAVSYAYPTENEGANNNGTPLYVKLHDAIFPGDPYYMSCDRGVAVAVNWSGGDVSYPKGATEGQYNYLKSSPKWESVGVNIRDTKKLKPGDVFVTQGNGHTFMYVGHEQIQKVHGSKAPANSNMVSASYGQRSPGCGNFEDLVNYDSRIYEAFRLVKPDNSDKWKHAG